MFSKNIPLNNQIQLMNSALFSSFMLRKLVLKQPNSNTHILTHTHTHTFIHLVCLCVCLCGVLSTDPYLHLLEHWMVLNPREEDPHSVGAVVQERDSCSVQLLSQFVDICLQLGKGWEKDKRVLRNETFKSSSSAKQISKD